IAWARGRRDAGTPWSRTRARALSGLSRQREPGGVLRALVSELARLRRVHGAWVWTIGPDQRIRTTVTAGAVPPAEMIVSAEALRALQAPSPLERIAPNMTGLSIPISVDPPLAVGVALEAIKEEDRAATAGAIHDLVGDAASLLSAAFERARREAELRALDDAARAIAEIDGEHTQAGVLASAVLGAERIVSGRAAIIRPSDGSVVVGDLPGGPLAELARDRRLSAIVSASAAPLAAQTLGNDATVALVSLSEGRVLAALGPPDVLSARLPRLEQVARAARDRLALLAERDALQLAANELGRDVQSLGGALRAKEDAMTTAVHELRNPLTAVHGYATLMSRNLQAVQGQLTQLERLMADLLSADQRTPGDEPPVEAAAEARQAIARARRTGPRSLDLQGDRHGARRTDLGRQRRAGSREHLLVHAALGRGSRDDLVAEQAQAPSTAGPVPGSGSRARRTLPAFRVIRFAHAAWRVPGAPAARAQPARPCHPPCQHACAFRRSAPLSATHPLGSWPLRVHVLHPHIGGTRLLARASGASRRSARPLARARADRSRRE